MNIKKDQVDELNAVITVKIEKPDYEERVDKILKDYRRKARFDGFRPGKVPQGLVNKMYRKPVMAEEINKVLAESLTKYLVDEKLNILGEPLPNEQHKISIDWDNDTDFEFIFDIGLAPELDLTVSENDVIPYYTIQADDEEIKKQIDRIANRYGTNVDSEKIENNEVIRASLQELNAEGNPVENGISVEETTVSLEFVKDEESRNKFKGLKKGDQVTVDIKKAFENETDRAAMLKIDKEKLSSINADFRITINSISRFEKAAINQDLFDKAYGKDNVKSEEEFRTKVAEELKAAFERNSDYRFRVDSREYFLAKFPKKLPDAFLKRWLLHTNDGKVSMEQIEKDYDHFTEDLRWQLIKGKISRDNELKISEGELLIHIRDSIRQQFIQYYGIGEVPADLLDKYAKESMGREEERNRYSESLNENKVFELIKKNVKLDTKEVTLEDFNKLFEK
ncbi:MAG TPA: trigger factor [Bacteroidales bacterium]|jgi:trigger factor|nr:trigger factor [Bacteroidales bacterium]